MNRHSRKLLCSLMMTVVISSCQAADKANIKMSNPATAKCLHDGWLSEPVLSNGIPTDRLCINPQTGKRCPEWSYFRGECRLSNDQNAPEPKK
ncbi:MAG: hypothetical protein ABL925_19955 [Methylococcales bacterium]